MKVRARGAYKKPRKKKAELGVERSLSCEEKRRRIRKWRRNSGEKGHTCSRLRETGRDVGISPTPVGEKEARRGEELLLRESSG